MRGVVEHDAVPYGPAAIMGGLRAVVLLLGLSLLPAQPVGAKARLRLQLVDAQTEKAREQPVTLATGKELIHFVHVPKTGGSSFGTVVKR